AYLGEGYSFNFSNPWRRDDGFGDRLRTVVTWMMEHRLLTGILLFVCFFLVLVLGVLFQWLSSRATFVYIDCVATNRSELARPWREHREIADSYFFWRLIFGFCAMLVNLLLVLPLIVSFISVVSSGDE